jgi:hypothetical protein
MIYRRESDGTYFDTVEISIAAGPAFYLDRLKSLFASVEFGFGEAAGSDYEDNDYTRLDLVIQPEASVFVPIAGHLSMEFPRYGRRFQATIV